MGGGGDWAALGPDLVRATAGLGDQLDVLKVLDSTGLGWPGVRNAFEAVGAKVDTALEKGAADAEIISQLTGRVATLEMELKLTRSEVKNLEGVGEMAGAEAEGLVEDLAVQAAGWEAECKEKNEAHAALELRTEALDTAEAQLESLETELDGVQAEAAALRAEVAAGIKALGAMTNARDDLRDEARRLKELSGVQQVEATRLRTQLADLRQQHTEALQDASRYQAEAERHGEKAGQLAAQTSVAVTEAERLRKWHDWAKAAEVTALRGELDVVKKEREVLQRDAQSQLAEHRRMSAQTEDWSKDLRATRADLFAREGRLGRVEAELAAARSSAARGETDLALARDSLERRREELQMASVANVKLRGKGESDRLRAQAGAEAARAAHGAATAEARSAHAAELETSRRDAAAAWKLAEDLETRMLSHQKQSTTNAGKYSKALDIGRRIEGLEFDGRESSLVTHPTRATPLALNTNSSGRQTQRELERENDRQERELERELQLAPH